MQDAPAAWSDIAVARHGDVCVITLNRPDKLNAYTGVMGVELARALHEREAELEAAMDTIGALRRRIAELSGEG